MTRDANYNIVRGDVNKNAVSAALGWTIGTTRGVRHHACHRHLDQAGQRSLSEPVSATRPSYQCNSETTLTYIQGLRNVDQRFHVNEKGAVFDGPLFDISGGTVKAAIGATYTTFINSTRYHRQHRRAQPDRAFSAGCE